MNQEGYPDFYGPMPEGQRIPLSQEYSLSPDDELMKTVMLGLAQKMERYGIKTLSAEITAILEAAEVIFKRELQEKKLPITFFEVVMRSFPHTDKDGAFSEHDRLVSFVMKESLSILSEVKVKGIDYLTRLPLRERFTIDFEKRLENHREKKSPFVLCILDIDHFKKANDTYGHQFGDLVLQKLSEYLSRNTRSSDGVYRYGGEEFTLLIEGNKEQVTAFLEKIVREVTLLNIPLPPEHQVPEKSRKEPLKTYSLTVSIGAIAFDGSSHNKSEKDFLIDQADQALYEVKHSGRNGFRFVPDQKQEKV